MCRISNIRGSLFVQLSPTPSGEAQKAYGFMVKKMQRITYNIENDIPFVMEATGNYHVPIALALQGAGFYVSIVNAILVHDYGNNSLRRAKTDKKDAIKLAIYGLDHWLTLPRYVPEEDTRMMLKTCYRQYQQCPISRKPTSAESGLPVRSAWQ